ncbi:MAG: exodeoxyribonuclease VII large subunit [Verrucomicrobiota bacterium]|nr:exodeoxyribonuclease VII large subunit [Verrucomicrobiota bacterium]
MEKAFSVSELTRRIKTLLEREVGDVWVEGEISNFRNQASGHCYFTLKDSEAQISIVMFRGVASKQGFALRDGLQVKINGALSVYEARGQYQIVAKKILQAGLGDLQARFEELKRKLQAEGLFDPARKKPIPKHARTIGIVTSPTGAALQDIINITRRRFPGQHIIINPVKVQGPGSAQEIAAAIDEFNALDIVDVIIIARGGGSLEDLWAFNEEVVARALFRSGLPVVSGVGHEIDFTIADFVADLRAPTPSAAAEIVVPLAAEEIAGVKKCHAALTREVRNQIQHLKIRIERLGESYVFREPVRMIEQYQQRLDDYLLTLHRNVQAILERHRRNIGELREHLNRRSPAAALAGYRQRFVVAQMHLGKLKQQLILRKKSQLDTLKVKLILLSPQGALERGYSITRDATGHVIRSTLSVKSGQVLKTLLCDGTIESVVSQVPNSQKQS